MTNFYVVWSVYDADHEVSVPIYRAVLQGRSTALVVGQATSLIPQVLQHHRDSEHYFKVENSGDVEIGVRTLEEWVAELKRNGRELPLVELDE